jgi:hypothetical protein
MLARFRFGLDVRSLGILTVTTRDPYNLDERAMTESSTLPRPRRERG